MTDTSPQDASKAEARARRLKAIDFKEAKVEEGIVELTLADILLQTTVLTDAADDATIELRPINFKGLALLEESVGQEALLALASGAHTWSTMLKIITVLVNQDLAPKNQLSEEEVGRLVDGKRAAIVSEIALEMLNPLLGGGAQEIADAMTKTSAPRQDGTESSTFAQANSVGP